LADYFLIDTTNRDVAGMDVHGNQYGMLAASKCFKMSEMTCVTCHDSHKNETGEKEIFSQKCMTCHNKQHNNFCKLSNISETSGKTICIDCHMPEKPSRAIMVLLQGQDIPAFASMRSHYIGIYPEETKKFLPKNH
jgi:hypothetical protein